MSATPQRRTLLALIAAARSAGARLARACAVLGLSVRTVERWTLDARLFELRGEPCVTATAMATVAAATAAPTRGAGAGDRRVAGLRRACTPPNKLCATEVAHAMALINSAPYSHLPPSQFVPRLADIGVYIASESTFYRLLRQRAQLAHRRAERAGMPRHKPRALVARGINEVFCWDITYLPSCVAGQFFYLYLFIDLFSRKIVGWQVFLRESATLASNLVADICAREGILPGRLTLHSDNGSPMKGETMLSTLQRLGVAPSRSRPSASNDNPFSESCFRTLKYRPECPVEPFNSINAARLWADTFVRWYNHEHRHCNINFVTPAERHAGLDQDLLAKRDQLYREARAQHPERWAKNTRNWDYVTTVNLNPDHPSRKPANIRSKNTT